MWNEKMMLSDITMDEDGDRRNQKRRGGQNKMKITLRQRTQWY